MWHLIGPALIRVNMVGPESQRHSSTLMLVANLKECLPGFMCASQQNLTRNDNLTSTKKTTNSLEAWKGPMMGREAPKVTGVWSPKAL